jgi:uncharacterized C2H2 Zn-finger protein
MQIEMVGYMAAHRTDEAPWRCVACEKLTKHSDKDIMEHMAGAHGFGSSLLAKDGDALFLHEPEPTHTV